MKKIYLLLFLCTSIYATSFSQAVVIADNAGSSGLIVIGNSNYHVSESIYTEAEIGAGNFITAGSAIQQLFFLMNAAGTPTAINSYRIFMKNIPLAIVALPSGAYSTAGYTEVFNGTYNATAAGFSPITLTTPFVRTAGSNLQILIERLDNTIHTGYNFAASRGNISDTATLSTRRYNNTVLPVSGVTVLTPSVFRPAIALLHTFPVDAELFDFDFPSTSCFNSPQTISVEIFNAGTTNIAAGAASVTLHIRGANTFTGTATNSAVILPLEVGFATFTGINLSNPGDNFDTAYVTLAGDGTTYNDTLSTVSSAATTISTFPVIEDAEADLPVFPYAETIVADQLWTLQGGPYSNPDQAPDSLRPRVPGDTFFLFDSYSGSGSAGFQSRLYSNCISLPAGSGVNLSFWMSHDDVFLTSLDSLYVSVSTDRGATWNRINAGYQRADATATTPLWRIESLSLSAYAGQTIQIGFEGVSDWGNAFGLDDITLSVTLPVSLLDFNAQRNGAMNKLTWKTSQEANSSRFIIERSTNGSRFSEIGQVAAAGTSNTTRNYSFIDAMPIKGMNYYRLRLVDLDNSFKYSTVKNVRNMGSADFSFAPNPVMEQMKIELDADKNEKGNIIITDITGRQMQSQAINVIDGSNTIFVQTGRLSPGAYVIQIQLSDSRIVKKFNKL